MIEDYDGKATKTKGKLIFSEFKKVNSIFTSYSMRLIKIIFCLFLAML